MKYRFCAMPKKIFQSKIVYRVYGIAFKEEIAY